MDIKNARERSNYPNATQLELGRYAIDQGKVISCQVSSVKEVNDYQPTILEGEEKERVLKRILKYSEKLKYGIKAENLDEFSASTFY